MAADPEFRSRLQTATNPYGDGKAAERIMAMLDNAAGRSREQVLKKDFVDVGL